MTQETQHFVSFPEGSRLLGKVQGWVPEPSGVFPREGGGRQVWCHINSQLLCKSLPTPNPPSTINSAGSQAVNTKMSLIPRLCGAANFIPALRDIICTRQCHLSARASHECLSIAALQGVPAVQPVVTEGSADMLILYWGDRE